MMDLDKMLIEKVAFPLMERYKGNRIREKIRILRGTERISAEELAELQKEKLGKLLKHCIEKVPAYKGLKYLGVLAEKDPFKALTAFPVLTKQAFRSSPESYIAEDVSKESLIPNKTGGSTGEPVKFYIDRPTVEYYEAARWRGLSWWDIGIGDSSVMVWGSPIELNNAKKLVYRAKERFLKNRFAIPAYDLNPARVKDYVGSMNRFKPRYIYGYSSSLYLFSRLMAEQGFRLSFTPVGVVSTSETLHQFQREAIEKAFGCKTINEYGARDGGIIAYQCPGGSMHIQAENLVLEIVDLSTKEPVETGKTGLILVTDLNNFSMPRLRYQLGDIGALSKKECGCGIRLPVLEKLDGREDDIFVSSGGVLIHGHYFNHIARGMASVKQFQIIQHSRNRVSLKIVKSDDATEKELKRFQDEIYKILGNITLEVSFTDTIPPTASGKTRYALREFSLPLDEALSSLQ